jgi:hypothetical protein
LDLEFPHRAVRAAGVLPEAEAVAEAVAAAVVAAAAGKTVTGIQKIAAKRWFLTGVSGLKIAISLKTTNPPPTPLFQRGDFMLPPLKKGD